MATEKHKTTLEIGVDDRDLQQFGKELRRVFDVEPVERYLRTLEKITAELAKHGAAGGTGGGRGPGGGRAPQGGGHGAGGESDQERRKREKQPLGFWQTAAATGAGQMGANMLQRAGGVAGGVARGPGLTATALMALPIVGPALSGALATAERLTDMAISVSQAAAGAAGTTGIGALGGGMGLARYGITTQQLPSHLSQLAQESGLKGSELRKLAPEAIRMQMLTGISGGLMGGAAGASGGVSNALNTMGLTEDVIAAGLDAGFRESRLPAFIQSMASDIEQMRSRGIMIDPMGIPSLVGMLGRTGRNGLQGEAGAHAAKTLAEALSGSGERNDFYGALAMQTAMDRGMSPFEAMRQLEDNPQQFVPDVMARVGQMGGSSEAKAMALKKWMPNLSLTAAMSMVQAAESGEMQMGAEGTGYAGAQAMVNRQDRATRGAFGLAGAAAGQQNADASAGAGVSGSIMRLRGQERSIGRMVAPIGGNIADMAERTIGRYKGPIASGDWEKVMSLIGEDISGIFDGVVGKLKEAFSPESIEQMTGRVVPSSAAEAMDNLATNSNNLLVTAINALIRAINGLLGFLGLPSVSIPEMNKARYALPHEAYAQDPG